MKIMITILTTVLAAAIAQASPNVGDTSEFAYTDVSNGTRLEGSYSRAISAMDATTLTVVEDVTFAGRPQGHSEVVMKSTDILTPAQIQVWLDYCAQNGGVKETLSVPAGLFETCHTQIENGSIWLGQVPLGIVKQEGTRVDGSVYSMELRTFSFGL